MYKALVKRSVGNTNRQMQPKHWKKIRDVKKNWTIKMEACHMLPMELENAFLDGMGI